MTSTDATAKRHATGAQQQWLPRDALHTPGVAWTDGVSVEGHTVVTLLPPNAKVVPEHDTAQASPVTVVLPQTDGKDASLGPPPSWGTKRTFTMEEVAQHNHADSCWLVSHGRVYDVTSWLKKHPAGEDSILRHAGTDATRDFDFHSKDARTLWRAYEIGRLEGSGVCIIL